MTVTKRCPICGEVKEMCCFDTYYCKARKRHRPQNYCKACQRPEKRKRSSKYYEEHKTERLDYAKKYRQDPSNKEKRRELSKKFKTKYREDLQDCYVRDRLHQENGISTHQAKENPELVEAKRLQIKIKRKIKSIKNEQHKK